MITAEEARKLTKQDHAGLISDELGEVFTEIRNSALHNQYYILRMHLYDENVSKLQDLGYTVGFYTFHEHLTRWLISWEVIK